jgi:hypothetical protein
VTLAAPVRTGAPPVPLVTVGLEPVAGFCGFGCGFNLLTLDEKALIAPDNASPPTRI